MPIDATIVTSFGEGISEDDVLVVIELDDELNLDDDGETKTTFYPGDECYFYVHLQAGLTIDRITVTSGARPRSLGSKTVTKTEQMFFPELNEELQLGYFINGISYSWYGNAGSIEREERTLKNNSNLPCVADVTYTFTAWSYRYDPPAMTLAEDETYPVGIVVHVSQA